MLRNQFKCSDWIYILFAIISLIILVDFILPGKSLTEPILKIEKEHQQYYNAARNYHYTLIDYLLIHETLIYLNHLLKKQI